MMKYVFTFFIFFIFCSSAYCQKKLLTEDDFMLCLDTLGCAKNLRITKSTLLSAKKVSANFSWIKIKKTIYYFGAGNYTSEVIMAVDEGNIISDKTKQTYFQRLGVGSILTIVIEGYNPKGQNIPWPGLSVLIIE